MSVQILQNNEYATVFEGGHAVVTGVLTERLTNLSDPSKSIELNTSSPGVFTPTADGGFEWKAEGPWLFFFGPGDLGPGTQGMLLWTRGLTRYAVDGSGNVSFTPARNTTDMCRRARIARERTLMKLTIKLTAVAALVLAAALLAASPAGALTKRTTIFDVDNAFVFAPGELCSFPVAFEQGPGQIKVDEFFDANGNIVKAIVTNYGGIFYTTFSANGVTLKTVQTFSDFLYFNPDGSLRNAADAGINYVITLPHQGAVFLNVGLIVFDSNFNPIFLAGPGFRTAPNIDALCAALS